MAAWKTYRLVVDVLVTADDADELPNMETMTEAVNDSLSKMAEALDKSLMADEGATSMSLRYAQELVLPDAPPPSYSPQ